MLLLEGGLVIDPASGIEAEQDILIIDGKIKEVAKPGNFAALKDVKRIKASGRWITPGLIDLHVHLREPGQEWKETIESGTTAAILGGYTTVCCMPNTTPVNDHAEITNFIKLKASQSGRARVLPIGSVSRDLKGKEMAPLSELHAAGCVAFSDDGEPVFDSGLMRRALEWCRMLGVPISCHEEDKCLSCSGSMNESPLSARMGLTGSPKVAEEVMIARDIELARTTAARVHFCHVSTARGAELIRRAKRDGIPVSAEVTPHHLLLTQEMVEGYNTSAKMNPPLRDRADCEALIEALADGTIDAVASDHAPHERDRKECPFTEAAFGILGLQTSLPLVLELVRSGRISRARAVAALTSSPANAFNLPFGSLKVGATADVCIIDPLKRWQFKREVCQSLSFNSPFVGRELIGQAEYVIVGGTLVLQQGALV